MNNEKEQNQETLPMEQTAHSKQGEPEKQGKSEKRNAFKQLSPQEREKLKKAGVFSALGILFVLVMWIIFAPSADEKKKAEEQIGLNNDIPQASNLELPDDKLKAYDLGTDLDKENDRQDMLGNLYDYFDRESENRNNALSDNETENDDPVAKSVSQYQETTRMLQSFNEPPAYDPEKEQLWNEVTELRNKLIELEESKNEEDDHIALMEKSYQLAAKYLPQNQQATPINPFETAIERGMNDPIPNAHAKAEAKEPIFTVSPDTKNIVSSLYQEVSDSVFIAEQMQERNRSFISATEIANETPDKNTLKVSVHETLTLKDGETVRLRLLETARVANLHLPKNKILTATAKIQGNRLMLSVTHIEQQERIISVNLSAYDLDGQAGIFIPNSEEMNAVKEVVAGMGQSAGTSFTFNSSAGQQLAADVGKGVMQGASQFLNKKMREVKVNVKSGHLLYLIANK
jgi:conjugative transposon TraM protein